MIKKSVLMISFVLALCACGNGDAQITGEDLSDGKILNKLEEYLKKDDDPEFLSREVYYDLNGNVLTDISYDSNGTVYSTYEYLYDKTDGHLIKKTYITSFAESDYFCYYDENGRLMKIIEYRDDDSAGDRTEYAYDDQNRLMSETVFNDDYGEDAFSVTAYTYDDKNHVIREDHSSLNAYPWYVEYAYDENGNVISISYWEAEGTYLSSSYTQKWDDQNRLIEKTAFLDDEAGGSNSIDIYEYDENGNLTKVISEISYTWIDGEPKESVYEYSYYYTYYEDD